VSTAEATRVLLVEDNAGFVYLVRDLLVRKGHGRFTVDAAGSLAEALSAIRAGGFDVVLLDLGLPDSRRIETFSRMRAAAGDTPIVILTVLNDDEVAHEAMKAGAQDYLVKDQVDESLLKRSITYAIERAANQKALHDMSARLLQLQDEERRRLARELHDGTAQDLAALSMNLSVLRRHMDALGADGRAALADSVVCAERCASELKTMSHLLYPPLLEEMGLAGVVKEYVDGFADRSGIAVELDVPADLGRLPPETETALFRVMQESLANILRHSGSSTAAVRFTRGAGEIGLEVNDKGRGMPGELPGSGGPGGVLLGIGIRGMRERMRQLGGRLDIASGPGGTTVKAVLPFMEIEQ